MSQAISLTLNEAGYVVGQTRTAINRAVDRGVIKAKVRRLGMGRLRKIGPAELRFLAIVGEVEKELTPVARRKIYAAIRRLPMETHRLELGVMEFRLAELDQRIAERLERLRVVQALVDAARGREPVLRGTTIPVHAVASLARGQSVREIVADFPGLATDQVEAAIEYAKIYPRAGRPLPARSFKRMLADLAASGVWDVACDAEQVTPRLMP